MRCHECGTELAEDARFCPSCGTRVPEPMSFEPPSGQQLDVLGDAMPERLTVVERVLQGDWRGPALAALAALLTAFVACQVALTTPLMFARGEAVPDHAVGNWLRGAAGLVGMAFGAPVTQRYVGDDAIGGGFFGQEQSGGIAALTVTFLTLGLLYVVLRRMARPETRQDAIARTVRTAVLFGGGVGIVSAFARFTETEGGSRTAIAVSWPTALVWATVSSGLVAAVAFRLWRSPVSDSFRATVSDWSLAVRGGLVGLGAGLVISAVVTVALLFGYSGSRFGGAGNVAKALPLIGAFLVNIATTVFAVACGGRAGFASIGDTYLSVFHRQGLSPAYLLLLLIPVVSVVAAVRYVARHRGERSDRDTVRACYRTAASATVVWFLLAIASQARVSAGAFGFGGAGPSLGLGLLLTPMWFLLGGYLLGRQAVRTVARVPDREPRPRRTSGPPYAAIVALAISGVVLTAVAAVALDGAPEVDVSVARIGGGEIVAPTPVAGFDDAEQIAVAAGAAEEGYHLAHGEYTSDPASLEPFGYPLGNSASVTITATDDTFCVQVSSFDEEYHYDSVDQLGEGLDCAV